MNKKNLLFVIPSLSAGGGEKSLVNLLTQMDYEKYHVDLFLFNHEGLFMDFLPKQVKILPIPDLYKQFSLPFLQSIKELMKKGEFSVAVSRMLFTLKNRTVSDISQREQYSWKYLSKSLNNLEKKYDAAIGFLEKTSTYFCVEKVNANKKIGWVHIDYDKLGMDPNFDLHYFENLNSIVTVSEECAKIFSNRFPNQQNKVEVIYNIVSPMVIKQMASQGTTDLYNRKKNEIVLLTVGRLHYQKGLEIAIASCRKVLDLGYNIRWYVIGEGEEREKLTRLIKTYNLEHHFFLLGLKANPYPYIKQADIYAQTSRFEGKPIALDEAMILGKPILVTNFSTATDQIQHGKTGVIVEMNAENVARGIEKLILDKELRNTLTENLAKIELGTEMEIKKLYRIL